MVEVIFDLLFKKSFQRIKHTGVKDKIISQIIKLKTNPELGKPMRYERKGTRELYISPYRLSYCVEENKILILALYHKDEQ